MRIGLIWIASLIALLAALVVASAGLGYRFQLWDLGTAFTVLRVGAYAALVGAVLALAALIAALARPPRVLALVPLVAFVAAAIAVYLPFELRRTAQSVPPINDITTDPADPPAYVAVVEARGPGDQTVAYPGEAVAAQQREAYPDIQPLVTAKPLDQAYQQALAVARGMSWEIISEAPEQGRFEATDRTAWFGFADDVVVRVRSDGDGNRIDVRSSSRVGRSDIGKNASRIRAYLAQLETALAE